MPKYKISAHRGPSPDTQLSISEQVLHWVQAPQQELQDCTLTSSLPFFPLAFSCAPTDTAVEKKALSQGSIPGATQAASCPTPCQALPCSQLSPSLHCCGSEMTLTQSLPALQDQPRAPTLDPTSESCVRDPPQCQQPFISTITGFFT